MRIAYARHGTGPPLVIATCWLSHLQFDWESPVWRHFVADLGQVATIVRYDERGYGLSDWEVDDFGLEARVADLEAVVDHAGLDRFALMAMAQGGPVAISYAARHPERVTRLMFYGSYAAAFRDPTPEDLELDATFEQLLKVGWARPDSVFRRVFTSLMIPGATEEQMRWLDELQRVSVSAENAVAARRQRSKENVVGLLPAARPSDAGAPLPWRPDERLRGGSLPRLEHRQLPPRPVGELEPHRARRRAGVGRRRRRGGGLPRA